MLCEFITLVSFILDSVSLFYVKLDNVNMKLFTCENNTILHDFHTHDSYTIPKITFRSFNTSNHFLRPTSSR